MRLENNSRTKNSLLIMSSGLIQKMFDIMIGFVSRKIFITYLGIEYLGINGLFSNILSFLSLAELGIGSAITVYLYTPLAHHDERQIGIYMRFYKKCYFIIGCAVLGIGLMLMPFLRELVNFEQNVEINLYLVYFLFLSNSVASYWFFAYKTNMLEADQKGYIVNNITTIFSATSSIAKCIIIILFHKFELALFVELGIGIIKSICISVKVDSLYPVIKKKIDEKPNKRFYDKLFLDVRGLVLYNIAIKLFSATDNIIISTCLGTIYVGMCDNYTMIIGYITVIVAMMTASLGSVIGSLNVKEDLQHRIDVFGELDFANFWICCFCSICLGQLLSPFIYLVFGNDLVVSDEIVFCLVIDFFISTSTNITNSFKASMGLLREGCYIALIGGISNIILSVFLADQIGLEGVFYATVITKFFSLYLPSIWFVFRKGFNASKSFQYIIELFKRVCLVVLLLVCIKFICRNIPLNWKGFILQGLICVVSNVFIVVIYFRRKEFHAVTLRIFNLCKSIK